MKWEWEEAERRMEAGIPIENHRWPAIERSLKIFYGIPIALVVVFAIGMSAWGISHEKERKAEFKERCDNLQGKVQETWGVWKCITPK